MIDAIAFATDCAITSGVALSLDRVDPCERGREPESSSGRRAAGCSQDHAEREPELRPWSAANERPSAATRRARSRMSAGNRDATTRAWSQTPGTKQSKKPTSVATHDDEREADERQRRGARSSVDRCAACRLVARRTRRRRSACVAAVTNVVAARTRTSYEERRRAARRCRRCRRPASSSGDVRPWSFVGQGRQQHEHAQDLHGDRRRPRASTS